MTGTYVGIIGWRQWSDSSGGPATELAFGDEGIAFRQGATTSWGGWNRLIHSGNYTSYVPTKTGTGASGTWGISITGNAATATTASACSGNAATATKLATARTLTIGSTGKTFDGSGNVSWSLAEIGAAAASHGNHVHSDSLTMGNNIDYNNLVYDWSKHLLLQPIHTPNYTGVLNSPVGNDYGALITLAAGTSFPVQFAISNGASIFKVRSKYASDTAGTKWTGIAWRTLLHDGNYNSYAPTKTGTGASGTWGISITGNAATATTASACSGNAATATKAATLTTARTLTIGSTGKTFNGSANVSWTLAEIGAAAASHTHSYAPLTGAGTSGTWGISITGLSASCTGNAATATTASDSSKLGGLSLGNATQGSHPGANAVVRTDANGYLNVGWINTVSGSATGTPTRIYCSQDAYLRYYAPDNATLRRSMKAYITYGTSLPTSGMVTGDFFIKI